MNDTECKKCATMHAKQLQSMQDGINKMHDAINLMMKEYARFYKEESILKQISKICSSKQKDALQKIQELIDANNL